MSKDLMQKKYGKPQRFSDPYKDFLGEEKELAKIINKTDKKLDLHDFGWIFQMYLPAADYEEGLYYIPLCFEFMEKSCPFEANVCSSLFWYIEHFEEKLQKDGFYRACIKRTEQLFEKFTKDFEVINNYQPNPKYRLSKLKYGQSVDRVVTGLAACDETWEILSRFLFGLKEKGNVGSCWWIMVSYFVRDWIMYPQKKVSGTKEKKLYLSTFINSANIQSTGKRLGYILRKRAFTLFSHSLLLFRLK